MNSEGTNDLANAPTTDQQSDGCDGGQAGFERAKSITIETAQAISSDFGTLDRTQRLKLVKAFRAILIPRKARARKRRKEITAAYSDWKLGMRGLPLYRKHISGYDKLANWRRREKTRALMDAIRSRVRRERLAQREVVALSKNYPSTLSRILTDLDLHTLVK
jgi:hypothetical protein